MNRSAYSVRATARLVTVCAVLAGLFIMHGLPGQGCPSSWAPTSEMAHPAPIAAVADGPTLAAGAMAMPGRHPLTHSWSAIGADGQLGELCVATPPPSGWARLLALLLGVSVAGLAVALRPPTTAISPPSRRRRAPPQGGCTVLRYLCVSQT